MEYKCIPAPDEIVIEKSGSLTERLINKEKAVRAFAEIINDEAIDGWKFHSMESIAVTEKPGCFAALFGSKAEKTYFNMLVFSKDNEKPSSVTKNNILSEE